MEKIFYAHNLSKRKDRILEKIMYEIHYSVNALNTHGN